MSDFVSGNIEIYTGLQTAYQRMKGVSENVYLKILHAQNHFFNSNHELSSDYVAESTELLKDALRKFDYASMVLEQMHSIRETRALRVNPHLKDDYSFPPNNENDVPFLDELLFDHSLFIWRSFLDFYMKYLVYFCSKKYVISMNLGEFKKAFTEAEKNSKFQKVYYFFQQYVFRKLDSQKKKWGDILKDYRDKTAHSKLLVLTMKDIVTRTGQTIMEPTTQGQEISFFVQETFGNNAFSMLKDLMPILYGVEWIAGPYKPGIYN